MHRSRKSAPFVVSRTPFRNPNAAHVHISDDTTLNQYVDGFLDTGAVALVDVFRQGHLNGMFADTIVISLRLPSTPELLTLLVGKMLDQLIEADVLPERRSPPPAAEDKLAPNSNTGLPQEEPGLSAWDDGYHVGHKKGYQLGLADARD